MSKKKTTAEFIEDARKAHGYKYNYNLVKYKDAHTKVIIICPITDHGEFKQTPHNHLTGQGCPKCGDSNSAVKQADTAEDFIKKANKIHNNRYDYSQVNYKNAHTKVIISCPITGHGIFEQRPDNHISGRGCPKCGDLNSAAKLADTAEDFIKKANKIHNNRYDYSQVNYKNAHTKVIIICQKPGHGEFKQTPNKHLMECGCPKCSSNISKPEQQWLSYLNIPDDKQHRQMILKINNKKFKIDGFDTATATTNTIYEFYGDYYHGNPNKYQSQDLNKVVNKTFGQLYQNTKKREKLLQQAGYNLITIWESDWKSIVKTVKILIKCLTRLSN